MSTLALWLAIVGAGAITFALRLSFIALLGQIEIPLVLARALRFVPAAVLTAVVIPLLLYVNGAVDVAGNRCWVVKDTHKESSRRLLIHSGCSGAEAMNPRRKGALV